ncbi:MAG: tryptophan--tRNA ligase [Gammaproteobacteria bacterium]
MSSLSDQNRRVLSGMRPTGRLHLGHYHGVLKNWIELQRTHECFFFVADWHALTTHYEDPQLIGGSVWEMVIDWFAAGLDPKAATVFIQSHVVEHAELHLLLSMLTPLPWLERVPSFKDQQAQLKERDLATYGFLGYPLLQSADILIYKAGHVPVGEDQVPHVEFTREIARRFNFLYGREPDFADKAEAAVRKLGKKSAKHFHDLRKAHQQRGEPQAVAEARALLGESTNLSAADRERLLGFIEGTGKTILPEPQPLLTKASKMPGLDGRKMSKSYGNTIELREPPAQVEQKLRTMPTDPARVRRSDPGEPEKCPVWPLHQHYSSNEVQAWVQRGCRTAGIGCLDCKQPVIDAIKAELGPIQERAKEYERDVDKVRDIVAEGCARARAVAGATLAEVRQAMGLGYR